MPELVALQEQSGRSGRDEGRTQRGQIEQIKEELKQHASVTMDIKNSIDSHLETKFSIIQNQFEQIEKRFLSFEDRLSNPNINRPEPDFSEIEQKLND